MSARLQDESGHGIANSTPTKESAIYAEVDPLIERREFDYRESTGGERRLAHVLTEIEQELENPF